MISFIWYKKILTDYSSVIFLPRLTDRRTDIQTVFRLQACQWIFDRGAQPVSKICMCYLLGRVIKSLRYAWHAEQVSRVNWVGDKLAHARPGYNWGTSRPAGRVRPSTCQGVGRTGQTTRLPCSSIMLSPRLRFYISSPTCAPYGHITSALLYQNRQTHSCNFTCNTV